MTKKLFDALSSIEYTVVSSDGKTPIESDKSLNPEISSLVFDIRSFKDTSYIARMIVYLFGTPESKGFFFFDNYRVVF